MGYSILVAGSRGWKNYSMIYRELAEFRVDHERLGGVTVIDGGAEGADSLGNRAALNLGFFTQRFLITEEEWNRLGRKAGPVRNQRMLDEGKPSFALIFWDGSSPGTKDMIQRLETANIPKVVFENSI